MKRQFRGKVDFVYAVFFKDSNPIKVGWSTNPVERVRRIAEDTGRHIDKVYLRVLKEGYGKKYEFRIHELLSQFQTKGEWFQVTQEQVAKAFENADWWFKVFHKYKIELSENKDLLLEFLKDQKNIQIIENSY